MSARVTVVRYNPLWPQFFAEEAKRVKDALKDTCVQIHHIGSTSVEGLVAKPIIDMLPVVKEITAVDEKALQALGYTACGEFGMPFRRYFHKGESERTHQLHIWEEGNAEIEKHLLFRNWLRSHPEDARIYETLKIELAHQHARDRFTYTAKKDQFIQEILQKAGFAGTTLVEACIDREWQAFRDIYEQLPRPALVVSDRCKYFVFSKGTRVIGIAKVSTQPHPSIDLVAIDHSHQNQGFEEKLIALISRWISHQV